MIPAKPTVPGKHANRGSVQFAVVAFAQAHILSERPTTPSECDVGGFNCSLEIRHKDSHQVIVAMTPAKFDSKLAAASR